MAVSSVHGFRAAEPALNSSVSSCIACSDRCLITSDSSGKGNNTTFNPCDTFVLRVFSQGVDAPARTIGTIPMNRQQGELPKAALFAVVGIVGGVGSGKSAVTSWVADHWPLARIDGDRIGHAVLRHPQVKQQLVEHFGRDILDGAGEIARNKLGRLVWGQGEPHVQARNLLERIVHPRIREEIQQQIHDARASGKWGVLLDAAVMLESGWSETCDRLVFIETPEEERRRRVASQRGWDEAQWREREQSQLTLDEKRARVHFIVDNSGTVEQAGQQLMEYLQQQFGWRTPGYN